MASIACSTCGASLSVPDDPNALTMACQYCGASQPVPDAESRRRGLQELEIEKERLAAELEIEERRIAAEKAIEQQKLAMAARQQQEQRAYARSAGRQASLMRWVSFGVSTLFTLLILGFVLMSVAGGMFVSWRAQPPGKPPIAAPQAPAPPPPPAPPPTPPQGRPGRRH